MRRLHERLKELEDFRQRVDDLLFAVCLALWGWRHKKRGTTRARALSADEAYAKYRIV